MTYHYLALGDSYTIGEGVTEEERFPNQIAAQLAKEGISLDVQIIARTGWTTDELWQGIQAEPLSPPYDMVSLLIGVNNQYRKRSLEEYRQDFIFLLGKAIEYAGGAPQHVMVFSIPDWGITPFARERELITGNSLSSVPAEIDAFNAVNLEETQKAGAHYINITAISRTAEKDPALLASDKLHPSGSMYSQWVDLALPLVTEILK